MDIQNPAHQEVMRLEGIQQKWMPPRQEGYAVVSKALAVSKRHFSSSTGSTGSTRRTGASHSRQRSSLGHLEFGSHRAWNGVRHFSSKPTVGVVGAVAKSHVASVVTLGEQLITSNTVTISGLEL